MIIDSYIKDIIDSTKLYRTEYVDKELNWYGSDQYKTFNSRPNDKKKSFWKDKDLVYKFNNHGYRTPDNFEKGKKGIVTLGCSFTEGIGLPIEYVWSYKMANHFNLPFYNLSVGSRGIRDSFERLVAFDGMLDYDYVFLLIPPKGRVNFYFKDNDLFQELLEFDEFDEMGVLPNSYPPLKDEYKKDFQKWFTILFNGSKFEEIFYEFTYLNLIKYYIESKGKKIFYSSFEEINREYTNYDTKKIDSEYIEARDGHWDSKKQHFIYEFLLKKYEEFDSNRASR